MLYRQIDKLNELASHVGVGKITLAVSGEFYIGANICRIHGGKSTGPITDAGKWRCAEAKTVHGRETWAIRAKRRQKMAELRLYGKLLRID